tara:strand:+ start:14885 stop:15109 length:225 start_codon:yes stop_codon:yes gene_type:complete
MISSNGNESKTIYEAHSLKKVESLNIINKQLTKAIDEAEGKLEEAVRAKSDVATAVLTEQALLIIKDAKLELTK